MRYAIFTDIHANLEALEAVLAKIDELAQQEPIAQLWFLGDLVGYGPNPNECIAKLRERTDVIIAGNHDWAAVGKLDLEDFSDAARISAVWTAEQLTEENRTFLANLPERIQKDECLLVHGSPYGPLWEYLTSEVLAERSFQHFSSRFCFVGHTHVPVIFQQHDTIVNTPTMPLEAEDINALLSMNEEALSSEENGLEESDETSEVVAIHAAQQTAQDVSKSENPFAEAESLQAIVADAVDAVAEIQQQLADDSHGVEAAPEGSTPDSLPSPGNEPVEAPGEDTTPEDSEEQDITFQEEITPEETIASAEERLNEEIEELLTLLGLSQSMIRVTNEMVIPPEGEWQAPPAFRAIVNPGGVGQPRDGDARAAFMIYDTEKGFTFYRVPYSYEKTQEKIIKAKLPQYLATRLAYGR